MHATSIYPAVFTARRARCALGQIVGADEEVGVGEVEEGGLDGVWVRGWDGEEGGKGWVQKDGIRECGVWRWVISSSNLGGGLRGKRLFEHPSGTMS